MKATYETDIFKPITLANGTLFLIKVKGDSMINAGINTGDYLLVDRNHGNIMDKIIIAQINGNWTVKRFTENYDGAFLIPENTKYQPIPITENDDFKVVGKVVKVIRSFN